jgi:hypothetical protein
LPAFQEVGIGIPDYPAPTDRKARRTAALDDADAHSPRRDAGLLRLAA